MSNKEAARRFEVGDDKRVAACVWVSDITYVSTAEGWLYQAAVMVLCTGKIVGWAMGERVMANVEPAVLI